MGSEVEMNAVFSQQRSEGADEIALVAVHSIGKDGVMSYDAGEGASWRGQLLFEPLPLVCLFGCVEMKPLGFLI